MFKIKTLTKCGIWGGLWACWWPGAFVFTFMEPFLRAQDVKRKESERPSPFFVRSPDVTEHSSTCPTCKAPFCSNYLLQILSPNIEMLETGTSMEKSIQFSLQHSALQSLGTRLRIGYKGIWENREGWVGSKFPKDSTIRHHKIFSSTTDWMQDCDPARVSI